MRLSSERIQELQHLLKTEFDLEYDDEQAQQAGLSIMRFVISKQRKHALEEKNDGDNKHSLPEVSEVNASNTNN